MDLKIKGRVALVTAASRGLGWSTALRLSMEGVRVVICSRDRERIEDAANRIREQTRGDVTAFAADVTDHARIGELVAEVRDVMGSLDILVCNAGGPPAGPHHDFSMDDYRSALELNLLSTVNLCYETLPVMKDRRWGRIIAVTSVAARQPLDNLILSNTARTGVLGFIKTLSNQVAQFGITVNSLCPGYTKTERVEELARVFVRDGKGSEEDFYEKLYASIPMGRIGAPDEFAQAAAFLASDGAGYITGVALQVDGGFYRGIM